jgi:hypothetical protein
MGYVARYVISRLVLLAILGAVGLVVVEQSHVRLPFSAQGGGLRLPGVSPPAQPMPLTPVPVRPIPTLALPGMRGAAPASAAAAPPAGR